MKCSRAKGYGTLQLSIRSLTLPYESACLLSSPTMALLQPWLCASPPPLSDAILFPVLLGVRGCLILRACQCAGARAQLANVELAGAMAAAALEVFLPLNCTLGSYSPFLDDCA